MKRKDGYWQIAYTSSTTCAASGSASASASDTWGDSTRGDLCFCVRTRIKSTELVPSRILLTVSMVVGMATPAAGRLSVSMQHSLEVWEPLGATEMPVQLTRAVGDAVGNDRGGSARLRAGLIRAVTNTVGEGGVRAQAVGLVG